MDKQKVCFICCTNNLLYEKECRIYLEHLTIPQGMQAEIKMVHGAASMAAGYNHAMGESDAKYKVYLHQDVFLLNQNFISDMLRVFEDRRVGMLGVVGGADLPSNGIAYASWNQGRLKTNTSFRAYEMVSHMKKRETSVTVMAVDGLLIATQYDLPWREDLFDGWDFYDISQALEFKKAGYLVKVPKQEICWCFHDDGFPDLKQYEKYRKIFVREYGSFLRGEDYADQVPFDEGIWNIVQRLKGKLIQLFDDKKYGDIYAYLSENYQMMSRDADLAIMGILMQIWDSEKKQRNVCTFIEEDITWEKVELKYQKYKFWLYEMEFCIGDGERQIVSAITQNKISAHAIFIFIMHNTIEKVEMLERFARIYQNAAYLKYAEAFRREAYRLKEEAKNIPLKVIMVAHNQKELVQQALNALLHTAGIGLDDVIFVDNASEDGLREWLSEQGISKFIVCEDGMEGYSVILNAVIQEFQIRDDILILPPEFIVLPDTIKEMQRVLHLQDDIGAVSATVIPYGSEHGKDYEAALAYARMKQKEEIPDWEGLTSVPEVVMIKNNMRADAEMFDTSLILPENCILDFLYRGTEEDYQILMCKKAFCYQLAADGDGYLERFGENADQAVLKEKWNGSDSRKVGEYIFHSSRNMIPTETEKESEKKIAFILCCNDIQYQNECRSYLMELDVPEGYKIEFYPIVDAGSMAAGYNAGMKQSDAKYKVYLHQDVFIWNRRFIYELLEVFGRDSRIGMVGVLGGVNIPNDGVLYRAWNIGMTYAYDTADAGIKQGKNPGQGICQEVEAIDGMLMATQYDIPWREDLFDGWDFYDVSQSFEFRKQGYSVVIPHQEIPWCMHDCGRTKLQDYNQGRRIILQEYADFFEAPVYDEKEFSYNYDVKEYYERLKHEIVRHMKKGELNKALSVCEQYDGETVLDSDLSVLKKIVSVCDNERRLYGECRAWSKGEDYNVVQARYNQVKFLLWDAEHDRNNGKERLLKSLQEGLFSIAFVIAVGIHSVLNFNEILPVLEESVKVNNNSNERSYLEFIVGQIPGTDNISSDKTPVNKLDEGIAEIEQMCRRFARIREEELPEYRAKINDYLQNGNRDELSDLLVSQEFQNKFQTVTEMVYMVLVNQIYLEEKSENVTRTILDGHNSIEEIMHFFQEIKFALWRLEFDMEEAPGTKIMELIHQNQISACLLKYAVHVAGMDKVGLLGRLAALLLDSNMSGMAFSMLKYADELLPGTEEILCTMAELCLRAGKKEEALYCLKRVESPTNITETFRKLCEI